MNKEIYLREYIIFHDLIIGRARDSNIIWVNQTSENPNLVDLTAPVAVVEPAMEYINLFWICEARSLTSWVGGKPKLDHTLHIHKVEHLSTGLCDVTCLIIEDDSCLCMVRQFHHEGSCIVGTRIFKDIDRELIGVLQYAKCNATGFLEHEQ